MSNNLDVLAQYRDALLLAEATGWLHDYRKCSDEQLKSMAANQQGKALERDDLKSQHSLLSNVHLQLPIQSTPRTVLSLLNDKTWKNDLLGQYLERCHKTAHFDKQEPVDGRQYYPGTCIGSPFGFERAIPSNLTNQLWSLPWQTLVGYKSTQRDQLRQAIAALFSQTVADTRRPINEVDLWNWGLLVGALYKAALAGALLSGTTPAARDLRWRLLSVRINGLDYLLSVVRIPDLLARQQILSDSLDKVRELLEVTYPLGSEVYCDENGSIYVVPDLPDLLQRTDCGGNDLRTLILEQFAHGTLKANQDLRLGREIVPSVELEQTAWWGQDPNWSRSSNQPSNDKLPGVANFLSRTIAASVDAREVKEVWNKSKSSISDICTVCGLRPQGPSKRATERNVCDICEKRRADRSKEWATSQSDKTIWTDEVADENGRLALIVGQFDLTNWLDGSLLETLFAIAPCDPQNTQGKPVTSKTPSFSRLRRIWETTRCFWQEVQVEILQKLTDDRRRLKIYLNYLPNLEPFRVYDLNLGATSFSVVWVSGASESYLISADNLSYVARQLGAEPSLYSHSAKAVIFVEEYLRSLFSKNNHQLVLHNPDIQASQAKLNLPTGIQVTNIQYQNNKYATAIPILSEPRIFMILVPADKSIEIVHLIKQKYECEMGKVRDRLPLHLGVVYANRRTPVRALLEAGRFMLDRQLKWQKCIVESTDRKIDSSNKGHFEETMILKLKHKDKNIIQCIPLKMRDGSTDDIWYPYIFLETEGDDYKAYQSNRRAVKVMLSNGSLPSCWVVHASDLQSGEEIYIMPSTFDFEFLDTTSRRFDIYYDQTGRRPRSTRPFYLEDLDRLEELWELMKRLTVSQRHQVIRTIEATREEWYGTHPNGQERNDPVFQQFVADTLAGAAWPRSNPWSRLSEDERSALIEAGIRGELADLAELHMEILKER